MNLTMLLLTLKLMTIYVEPKDPLDQEDWSIIRTPTAGRLIEGREFFAHLFESGQLSGGDSSSWQWPRLSRVLVRFEH